MPDALVLAIDQGTTGTVCIVFDEELRRRGRGYAEVAQHFPRPAWVEHDPEEIWISVLTAAETAIAEAGVGPPVPQPSEPLPTSMRQLPPARPRTESESECAWIVLGRMHDVGPPGHRTCRT